MGTNLAQKMFPLCHIFLKYQLRNVKTRGNLKPKTFLANTEFESAAAEMG